MNPVMKLQILDHFFKVHDEFSNQQRWSCHKGCADCCTRNVTITTLEGLLIFRFIEEKKHHELLDALDSAADGKRFQPRMTINQIAEICMRGEDPPFEEIDPSWGSCPFLQDNECRIYPVRPMGCRSLLSIKNCRKTGFAETAPFTITVNEVFLQYIEHLDEKGYTGNLIDVLLQLKDNKFREWYQMGLSAARAGGLISNRAVRVLMVPPEHQSEIMPILHQLRNDT